MEVVVNDTNILIDLCNAGLLGCCRSLGLDFRTLDLVMNEIRDEEQHAAVQAIVDDGTLTVISLSGSQIQRIGSRMMDYKGVSNLSFEDVAVMEYSIENGYRLLTGDRKLREKALLEGLKVSGVLYVTDLIRDKSVMSNSDLADALRRLMNSNNRLPMKLTQQRIDELTGDV